MWWNIDLPLTIIFLFEDPASQSVFWTSDGETDRHSAGFLETANFPFRENVASNLPISCFNWLLTAQQGRGQWTQDCFLPIITGHRDTEKYGGENPANTLNKTEKCEESIAGEIHLESAVGVSTGGRVLQFGLEPWWTCQLIKAKWSTGGRRRRGARPGRLVSTGVPWGARLHPGSWRSPLHWLIAASSRGSNVLLLR